MSLALSPNPAEPLQPAIDQDAPAPSWSLVKRLVSRLLSLALLALLVVLLFRAGLAVTVALGDGLITPLVLSPENEAVVQNKVAVSRLLSEREAVVARVTEARAQLAVEDRALQLLSPVAASIADSLARRRSSLDLLGEQRQEIDGILKAQEQYVADLGKDLAANLIRRSDMVLAESTLHQLRLARLNNERDRLVALEQIAEASSDAAKLQIEILRRQSERGVRLARKAADEESVQRMGQLLAQLEDRISARAGEASQNLAFVAYSQVDKVEAGASIVQCKTLGIFGCHRVGKVEGLLAGEVTSRDAGDRVARGQYAVLDLEDAEAIRSKVLRVRPGAAGTRGAVTAR